MRMTLRQLGLYLGHIPSIMAREAITNSIVAAMPHMDEDVRQQVLHEWSIAANPGQKPPTSSEKIGFDDFASEIKQRLV